MFLPNLDMLTSNMTSVLVHSIKNLVVNNDDDRPKGESIGDCACQDEDYVMESESPQLFSQSELIDLVPDLPLSKRIISVSGFWA